MNILNFLKSFISFISDERCVACDINRGFICDSCKLLIPLNRNFCQICAYPFGSEISDIICGKCLQKRPVYKKTFSPLIYEGFIRDVIIKAKFEGKFFYYTRLLELVYSYFEKEMEELKNSAKVIVPIPLSKERLIERGYNQSMIIAKFLSKKLKLPILYDKLIRVKNTKPQSKLGEKDRIENIKGAFLLKKTDKTDKIVLVDDIITSGATINEAALALKKGGVNEIQVFSLCRASF